ncbi:MAG: hypothetical protein WAK13_03185 [Terriglobales bacterium]
MEVTGNMEVTEKMDQASRLINLSFIIRTNGEIVPAMPDDDEFSPQQIRDYVAGPPELFCQTHDGFFLFHNKEGKQRGLPANELATAMYLKPRQHEGSLLGRVLVAHPDHIASYWKGE